MAVTERFDAGLLAEAKRLLWDKCKSNLEGSGLSYHVRRDSGKRSQAVAMTSWSYLTSLIVATSCPWSTVKLLTC